MPHIAPLTIRNYPGIGPVTYRQSLKAKRVRIQVKPSTGVIVTMPRGAGIDYAEGFLLSQKEWLLKSLEKTSRLEARRTIFRPDIFFSTREHRLQMLPENRTNITALIGNGEVILRYPEVLPAEDPRVQDAVRKAIIRALTREAMVFLPGRLHEHAVKHGLKYADIKVRNNRSRWGSCAANGNISLNVHLMRLPDELIDYIILHELAHTVHPNHGPGFHGYLEHLFPGHREAEARLRRYSPSNF